MVHEAVLRLGTHRRTVALERGSVLLCDSRPHAKRVSSAFASAGVRVIDGSDEARSTVADRVARHAAPGQVANGIAELQLPEDILDWRLRDCSPLQRMLADSLLALLERAPVIVFDITGLVASPFDVAHAFAHIARLRRLLDSVIAVVIADAAYISSAGDHLIVMSGDDIIESGSARAILGGPTSDVLRARLASTPVANPLAMQARRVQRIATQVVDYSHTRIIAVPTEDSIALAGGEATP